MKVVQVNKKARFEYHIDEVFEAGIKLVGSEIKSVRQGKVSIAEAFISIRNNEAFIIGMQISHYDHSASFNHEEKRDRKLLLHKRQIERLHSKTREQGYTIIPLKVYFKQSLLKVEIALARGKKTYDKRQDLKEKDMQRRMQKANVRR